MKILCFKFNQNRTINTKFDFFEGERRGPWEGKIASIHKFQYQLKHMKIMCLKFNQNRTINEEFDLWGV